MTQGRKYITLGINSATIALLMGYGYTKRTMMISNVCTGLTAIVMTIPVVLRIRKMK